MFPEVDRESGERRVKIEEDRGISGFTEWAIKTGY